MYKKNGAFLFAIFFCLIALQGCFGNRKISSFKNLNSSGYSNVAPYQDSSVFEIGDIIQIQAFNLDDQTMLLINSQNTNGTYKLDEGGIVQFPILGAIKVLGLNKFQVREIIENGLIEKKIGLNPMVSVKITNFHITILGEVNKPGVIICPEEGVTITEAIGYAGDLTVYAKRNNILLIREKGNKRNHLRFSLNDSNLFEPSIYHLKNRDIIYIESNAARAFNSSQSRSILGFTTGILSLFILITSLNK